ncbi:hypothetical protein [Agrobacterium sp. fls2-241-TYG-188a]|uniref:hypothetical protein n=1 Tax=Agrobacterium sp. fls2-241-TYG-188a TaxID=3040275 RepID=UPI00254DBC66|nr:hypothetical protein [Agrobacterium sp. fls2-241-TYG-188a]
MTENLPATLSALRKRLTSLNAIASDVQETSLLTGLKQDLTREVEALDRALTQCKVLTSGSIKVDIPNSLAVSRSRASAMRESFAKDSNSKSLKKGSHWSNLIKALSDATSDLGNEARASWKDYRDKNFTGDAPAVFLRRMAGTEKNQDVYRRYEAKYQALRSAFDTLPQKQSDIDQARLLAKELTELAGEFDLTVPADVKVFLDKVQSGGAPLDHLNQAVINWLKENHAFESYRIVPSRL